MGKQKRFRQGQILKLITSEAIASQDDLRRRLAQMKLRVTQATLSRDIAELKLVKTAAGYKPLEPGGEEDAGAGAAGARGAGISAGRSPGGQSAGAEDAAGRSAGAGRGRG